MNFMDFMEHADAIFRKGTLTGFSCPPLSKSHIFHLGDDSEITKIADELEEDLTEECRDKIPLPFADTSIVTSQKHADGREGWIMDRIVEHPHTPRIEQGLQAAAKDYSRLILGYGNDPDIESRVKAFVAERTPKQAISIARVEDHAPCVILWSIAYFGIIPGMKRMAFSMGSELVRSELSEADREKKEDWLSAETPTILRQTALISHPSNYYVKIEPKLTPREARRVAAKLEPRPIRKTPHFIVIDHEQLVELNKKHGGGTHASPVPHLSVDLRQLPELLENLDDALHADAPVARVVQQNRYCLFV